MTLIEKKAKLLVIKKKILEKEREKMAVKDFDKKYIIKKINEQIKELRYVARIINNVL